MASSDDNRVADNIDLDRAIWFLLAASPVAASGVPASPVTGDFILQETGFLIRLEDGSGFIVQE
jgi:hypothetical protein